MAGGQRAVILDVDGALVDTLHHAIDTGGGWKTPAEALDDQSKAPVLRPPIEST
ncbi:MAG TPA: hypothetical protein VGJ45_26415 [Pseudonocardiaceae bacterium]